MALWDTPLDDIEESHLQRLIDAEVPEARQLEFKRETYPHNKHDEFLADVSSFANTIGGDLIIGMIEKDDVPIDFAPIQDSAAAEILRLENLARDRIEPRLQIQSKAVRLARGGDVLVLRVSRSYRPPHCFVRNQTNRFFVRSTRGKHSPDVEELRALFNIGPQLTERIRAFQRDRLRTIRDTGPPVSMFEHTTLVVHVVPFSAALGRPNSLPIDQIVRDQEIRLPGGRGPVGRTVNFNGVLAYSSSTGVQAQHGAYAQIYRTSEVEVVAGAQVDEAHGRTVYYGRLEEYVATAAFNFTRLLERYGVFGPYAVLVSLIDAQGITMAFPNDSFDPPGPPVVEIDLTFVEAVIEAAPTSVAGACVMVRDVLDHIANSGGEARSPSFNREGAYSGALSN